ncbi:unannotated protein [freshwater metagenome]|uniref:Unannotated protein n=1 Tax=freshwater metagenome TaxID=449393 RepID=A0A6J6F3T5_9ZZZZ
MEDRMRCTPGLPGEFGEGRWIGVVATDVTHLRGKAVERSLIPVLAAISDGLSAVAPKIVVSPLIKGYPDDGNVEVAAAFEAIDRREELLLGQIA